MNDSAGKGRALWLNLGLSALAFALLGLLVWIKRDDISKVIAGKPDPRLFVLAFGVYMIALVLTFFRWFVLVRALDLPFRFKDALRLGFIGNVFNLVIPGAVGGDFVKAAFLCREQARKTQAVASMIIDRLLGLLGLFILAAISGLGVWSSADKGVRVLIAVIWLAVVAGSLGLTILFTPWLYRPLEKLFQGKGKLGALFEELVQMAEAYRKRIRTVLAMLGLAVGIHSLFVVAFYIVGRALFPNGLPSAADHFVIVPPILFTTAVPLPFGALGLTEGVSNQLFRLVHHPDGAVAMLGFRVVMYAAGLVSACVYLLNLRQVRSIRRLSTPLPVES